MSNSVQGGTISWEWKSSVMWAVTSMKPRLVVMRPRPRQGHNICCSCIQWCIGGYTWVYGVYQPPGFFWQRILTSVIINKQGTFRPFATPDCIYPPPFLAIHHWLYWRILVCAAIRSLKRRSAVSGAIRHQPSQLNSLNASLTRAESLHCALRYVDSSCCYFIHSIDAVCLQLEETDCKG